MPPEVAPQGMKMLRRAATVRERLSKSAGLADPSLTVGARIREGEAPAEPPGARTC